VIVHNNWLVGRDQKIERARENLQWIVDKNYYYTSETKYIMYGNPLIFKNQSSTQSAEAKALEDALSLCQLLNRTLIAPKFHCSDTYCSHKTFVKYGPGSNVTTPLSLVKESTFLLNPKVPIEVKSSITGVILIESELDSLASSLSKVPVEHRFSPDNYNVGATTSELISWLQPLSSYNVLHFHSLYNAIDIDVGLRLTLKNVKKAKKKS